MVNLILLAARTSRDGRRPGGRASSGVSTKASSLRGDWIRLLLGACRDNSANVEAAAKRLLEARGGIDAVYDEETLEETEECVQSSTGADSAAVKTEDESDSFGVAVELENDEVVVERVKVEDDGDEAEHLDESVESNDRGSIAEASGEESDRDEDGNGHGDDEGSPSRDGDDGGEAEDDDDPGEVSSSIADTAPRAGSACPKEEGADDGGASEDEAGDVEADADARKRAGDERASLIALAAVADKLLYELYMAEPTSFVECLGVRWRR